MSEKRTVVEPEPEEAAVTKTEVGAQEPVVERRPVTRVGEDGGASAIGTSALIQTIVWSIVVLVLLGVGLWALHVYTGLF